jgi:hypothetical protein
LRLFFAALLLPLAVWRQRLVLRIHPWFEWPQQFFDFFVAGFDLLLVMRPAFSRLFQREQMLGLPVRLSRFADRLFAGLDVGHAPFRQHRCIPLSPENRIHDGHSRDPRNIPDFVVQLHIHLR